MLSNTAEYALRALVQLARAQGQAILGRDLSELADVPANYLSKILLDLKRAGIVTAERGTGGGYRLARPARKVRLVEVVEIFDQARARPRCLLAAERECSDARSCSAHERWKKVRTEYIQFLESTSLADIARAPGPKSSRTR